MIYNQTGKKTFFRPWATAELSAWTQSWTNVSQCWTDTNNSSHIYSTYLSSKSDFTLTGGAAAALSDLRWWRTLICPVSKETLTSVSVCCQGNRAKGNANEENSDGDEGAGAGLMWRRQRQAGPQTLCQLRPDDDVTTVINVHVRLKEQLSTLHVWLWFWLHKRIFDANTAIRWN